MNIQYIGENIWAGQFGHISILLSFISAFLATLFFYMSSRNEGSAGLKRLARVSYISHFLFLILGIASLYVLIFGHHFEYDYVWRYSARELPFHYLVSSLWAGQEGSYLLWAFWQSFLGLFLISRSKKWESPTMFWVALAQLFLMVMVVGLRFGSIRIGLDPFVLIREISANLDNPIFKNPAYLSMILPDGNGMNPLLENYWMVIHPPILFLGYSSVLISFSYAMAGFWTRDYVGWRRQAMPWLNFTGFVLGLGILLGGAWAYKSLTFGGFWAWDPVENASLVPWLASIAALHTLLISRKKPHNLQWAAVFVSLAYFLVLYAGYLTRSGVLKDTSAHAFGEEGRTTPLVVYMLVFLALPIITFIFRRPKFEDSTQESLLSREFWMFVGALVLILSAFQIIITTSIPVVNTLLGTKLAPPTNNVGYYNAWQMPYALLIAFFIGFAQNLKFGDSPVSGLWRKTMPALLAGLCVGILFIFIYPFSNPLHYLFLAFLVFGFISSFQGVVSRFNTKKGIGAWVAHLGLNTFLIGVLLTFSNNNVITHFETNSPMNKSEMAENQMLYKGMMTRLGPYSAKYVDHKIDGKYLIYQVDFYKPAASGQEKPSFTMYPSILINNKMGNVYEPYTCNFLTKDVYGYIVFAPETGNSDLPGYTMLQEAKMNKGDSIRLKGYTFRLDSINGSMQQGTEPRASIVAFISSSHNGEKKSLSPSLSLTGSMLEYRDDSIGGGNVRVRMSMVSQQDEGIILRFYEPQQEYLVVKVMVFPFIMVIWLGASLIFLGFLLSLYKRLTQKKPAIIPNEQTEA